MKNINQLLGILIIAISFGSCSTSDNVSTGHFIQKRKYNKGFHVNFKGRQQKRVKVDNSEFASVGSAINKNEAKENNVSNFPQESLFEEIKDEELFDNNLIASTDKSFFPQVHDNITERIKSTTSHKNKITNQPNYNSVKRINKSQNRINKKRNSLKSESNSNESQTGGGSQLVALLLVIFAGVMGIHRFYLGYIGIGIIQLLTGGGCGIWALIDLIRICTGDLKPNGGGYTDTL